MSQENNQWIEQNLQRQRKLLEEKQKQKRQQSAGSVRTTSTTLSMGSSMNDHPTFDSSAPAPSIFSDPLSYPSGNFSSPPADPPQAAPRYHAVSRSSNPTRAAPVPPTNEPLISISDQTNQDISSKLSKINVSPTVVSDDEDDDRNARDYSGVPWKTEVKVDNLQTEVQPDFNYIKNNLAKFVEDPVSERCLYKCTITRQKSGVDKGMFPTYYLHLESGDIDKRVKIFLLAARKRKKSTTANYLISCDPTNLSRDGDGYCAKVRSNALGTHFTIYDNGKNPKKTNNNLSIRQELAAVIYDTNVLGFKGPRKMTVIVPGLEPATETKPALRFAIRPVLEKHTLLERYKTNEQDGIKILQNKSPQWNDETQSYVLNFHGRVTQASVKNFQIIHTQSPEYIVMQFGRVSDDEFTMDFRYPLSVIQAFGIAMTSFHGKLACE